MLAISPQIPADADHIAEHGEMVDWQQEAQRLRCVLEQLKRDMRAAADEYSPVIPQPHKSRFLREIQRILEAA
jgi:hypothetical protein